LVELVGKSDSYK